MHRILRSTFESDPNTALKLVESFKNTLSSKELNVIQKRIERISELVDQYKELEEAIQADQKELKDLVKAFQKANGFEYCSYATKQGVWLDNVSTYGVSVPELKVVWQLPYQTKHKISTKLRLQTMSGDFDVYKLIEELVSEFSN